MRGFCMCCTRKKFQSVENLNAFDEALNKNNNSDSSSILPDYYCNEKVNSELSASMPPPNLINGQLELISDSFHADSNANNVTLGVPSHTNLHMEAAAAAMVVRSSEDVVTRDSERSADESLGSKNPLKHEAQPSTFLSASNVSIPSQICHKSSLTSSESISSPPTPEAYNSKQVKHIFKSGSSKNNKAFIGSTNTLVEEDDDDAERRRRRRHSNQSEHEEPEEDDMKNSLETKQKKDPHQTKSSHHNQIHQQYHESPSIDRSYEQNLQANKITLQRVQSVKESIETYYENLFNESRQRADRVLETQRRIADLSPDTQYQYLQKHYKQESEYLRSKRVRLDMQMFKTIQVIGRGGFGQVNVVQYEENGHVYAMKIINKDELVTSNKEGYVRAERDLMALSKSKWTVKMFFSFQDEDNVFLIMEFLQGGDLMNLLIEKDTFTEEQTQFYVAEIALAIQSIHDLGFIHRDIKPDNILIDCRGHIKLGDFGLSTGFKKIHQSSFYQQLKRMDLNNLKPLNQEQRVESWKSRRRQMAFSNVGTADYLAPEIVMEAKRGYTKIVDWWSLGVIMFEMLCGYTPFCVADYENDPHSVVCNNIVNWRRVLAYSQCSPVSDNAKQVISAMINDPQFRCQNLSDIESLPFFQGVDWVNIDKRPAAIPVSVKSIDDTSNFINTTFIRDIQNCHTDHEPNKYHDKRYQNLRSSHRSRKESLAFINFTYRAFRQVPDFSEYSDLPVNTCD